MSNNLIKCLGRPKYIDVTEYEYKNIKLERLREINKFTIDFKKNELIDYNFKFKSTLNNPNKFIIVLETTTNTFIEDINNNNSYKTIFITDYINLHCHYDKKSKKLESYHPRSRFIFYDNNKLVYCTYDMNTDLKINAINLSYHNKFITHKSFINIVNNINNKDYSIFPDIAKLYNITGSNALSIAKIITFIMSQDSLHMLQFFIRKLFNNIYEMGNVISLIIYKINSKYIIIKKQIISSLIPENNELPKFNDKLQITYIISENEPELFIKIDIIDIDNIIKNYNPLEKTSSELKNIIDNTNTPTVIPIKMHTFITPNKINFININNTFNTPYN